MGVYRESAGPRPPVSIARDPRLRNAILAMAGGAILSLAASFIIRHVGASCPAYAIELDDLVTGRLGAVVGPVRVTGNLLGETLVRESSPCGFRFSLEQNGFRVPVRLTQCLLPDPLEGALRIGGSIPVTVEGSLGANGFDASALVPRLPNCCFCTAEERATQLRNILHAAPTPSPHFEARQASTQF